MRTEVSLYIFTGLSSPELGMKRMIGQIISHYKILSKLGGGGMGVVYKAQDLKLDRPVAIKFLPPELSRDEKAKKRFIHEARAASALEHSSIGTIHEIDETPDGQLFIVMACYEGESLRNRLERGTPSIDEAIDIAIQIASGLSKAHEKGIVHRDIKPGNVLFTNDGEAKIVDFGLAKLAGQTKITKTGGTVGTVAFMSPEQARGEEVDARSDIFSFGAVLYELVTGRLPFPGDHEAAVLYGIVNEEAEPLSRYRQDVPEGLQLIVDKAMKKKADDRYQSAEDILDELRIMQRESAITSGTRPRSKGKDRRWLVVGSLVLLITIAVFVVSLRYLGSRGGEVLFEGKMLVVLPFENLGPPEDEYFSDGITDAITARLARVHGLGVISRQSAVQYKHSEKSLQEIGGELGVEYILEGTVQRERPSDPASRVRVIPQLIRVSDDIHLWADTYEEDMTEIFQVQSEIADHVAAALDVTLLEPERRALVAKPTDNLEAYEYYLRGNQYVQWNPETGAQMFEKAVQLEPDFAAAWAQLGASRVWLFHKYGFEDDLHRANSALDKAFQLAPDLLEAHVALGFYYYMGFGDYDNALRQFEIVEKLRPSDAVAARITGWIYRRQGKWERALSQIMKSYQLNPRASRTAYSVGQTYRLLRRYEEAERYLDRAIILDPDVRVGYLEKAMLYLSWDGNTDRAQQVLEEAVRNTNIESQLPGRYYMPVNRILTVRNDEMMRQLEQIVLGVDMADTVDFYFIKAELYDQAGKGELARACYDSLRSYLEPRLVRERGDYPDFHASLGQAYAGLGLSQDAIHEGKLATDLRPPSRDAVLGYYLIRHLAEIYAKVGEHEAAIEKLEYLLSAAGQLSANLVRLDPVWDPLRDHPRFQRLLEKYSVAESS